MFFKLKINFQEINGTVRPSTTSLQTSFTSGIQSTSGPMETGESSNDSTGIPPGRPILGAILAALGTALGVVAIGK